MNLEQVRAKQRAAETHRVSTEALRALVDSFNANEDTLKSAIEREFGELALKIRFPIFYGISGFKVEVPHSGRSVTVDVWSSLYFNEGLLRSEFQRPRGGGKNELVVVPPSPMKLPVEIQRPSGLRSWSIWWRGPGDNKRLAKLVVEAFRGGTGPEEVAVISDNCFVATVIFGEHSREVAVFRRWRDDYLLGSSTGRILVKSYYRLGPRVAGVCSRHRVVKGLVRRGLSILCDLLTNHS